MRVLSLKSFKTKKNVGVIGILGLLTGFCIDRYLPNAKAILFNKITGKFGFDNK